MFATVDVQGFKAYDNRFIVKEVGVVLNDMEYHCFHLKAPFEYQTLSKNDQIQTKWLKLYHHNLDWEYGVESLEAVRQYLKTTLKNKKIYVKGVEKQQWVSEFLQKPIFNIEDEQTDNSYNLNTLYNLYNNINQCKYHIDNSCNEIRCKNQRPIRCALKSALILRQYILKELNIQ